VPSRCSRVSNPCCPRWTAPDWDSAGGLSLAPARDGLGVQSWLQPVRNLSPISLNDLKHIDEQKEAIEQNTRQFVRGVPANNVLLTGSRGTGKSSLIKACLNALQRPRGCA
jgi:predicted AAA+ superfamily ATPase